MENPWPPALGLAALGVLIGAFAGKSGSLRTLAAAGGLLLAAILLTVVSIRVMTPAEHGVILVQHLVDTVETAAIAEARADFSPNAILRYGETGGEGHDRAEIDRGLMSLMGRNRIESNTVTDLTGRTTGENSAIIELACRTVIDASPYPVGNRWRFAVQRQQDGSWAIVEVVFLSIQGSAPRRGLF